MNMLKIVFDTFFEKTKIGNDGHAKPDKNT